MKQTAVDFLIKEFSDILGKIKTEPIQDLLLVDAVNKAKEIQKQYVKDAFIIGINNGVHGYKTSEEYYEKTYKK